MNIELQPAIISGCLVRVVLFHYSDEHHHHTLFFNIPLSLLTARQQLQCSLPLFTTQNQLNLYSNLVLHYYVYVQLFKQKCQYSMGPTLITHRLILWCYYYASTFHCWVTLFSLLTNTAGYISSVVLQCNSSSHGYFVFSR